MRERAGMIFFRDRTRIRIVKGNPMTYEQANTGNANPLFNEREGCRENC